MLDSDHRWVLTEAASEPPGNLPYAENLCRPLRQMQRKTEKRYSLVMRLSENPGMATMAATLWTETDSSRWGLPSNRFNVGDLVAFLVVFAHLRQHILRLYRIYSTMYSLYSDRSRYVAQRPTAVFNGPMAL